MFLADDYPIDLPRLLETRLLLQSQSGGGKSHTLRRLLEQTAPHVQQLVIDTEGEFATLREKFDYIVAAPHDGDAIASPDTAALLAKRLHESGVSAILDIYDLKADDRQLFVARFLDALMTIPRAQWHPVLVVIDEIQVYCPQNGMTVASSAVIDIATRGRKRGLCLVGAMLRLSKLHKDCAAELQNKLIGRTGLDIDIKRAADELGLPPKDARTLMRDLQTGEFYAFGPALSRTVQKIKIGPVATTHAKSGEGLMKAPPPASEKVLEQLAKLADIQKEADDEQIQESAGKKELERLRALSEQQRIAIDKHDHNIKGIEYQLMQARANLQDGFVVEWRKFQTLFHTEMESLVVELDDAIARTQSGIDARLEGFIKAKNKWIGGVDLTYGQDETVIGEWRSGVVSIGPLKGTTTVKEAAALSKKVIENHDDSREGVNDITRPQQRILDALKRLHQINVTPADRRTVAALCGVKHSSGSFANNLGALRSRGLIDYPGPGDVELTTAGRMGAVMFLEPLELADLHQAWKSICTAPQARLLDVIITYHPQPISKKALALEVDVQHTSGSFANNLGALRTMGAIDYPTQGWVKATNRLFPGF